LGKDIALSLRLGEFKSRDLCEGFRGGQDRVLYWAWILSSVEVEEDLRSLTSRAVEFSKRSEIGRPVALYRPEYHAVVGKRPRIPYWRMPNVGLIASADTMCTLMQESDM
jgi:hypothetical protein